MPDTRQPLGQTIINGLTGLIYDDPITLWGSAASILITWALATLDLIVGVWVGVVLVSLVWVSIGISLMRAAKQVNSKG